MLKHIERHLSFAIAATLIWALVGCAVPKNYRNGQPRYSGKVDANGRKTGKWSFYYPNGKKRCFGAYKAGKREGVWGWFYPNGKTEMILSFTSHYPVGAYREFDEKGVNIASGSFANGKKDGRWEIFGKGPVLHAVLNYDHGKLNGKCVFETKKKENGKERNWVSYEEFHKGTRKKAIVVSPDGKRFKLSFAPSKTIFPWRVKPRLDLQDEFMELEIADRAKLTELIGDEDRFLKDAERRFSPRYGDTGDYPPRR